MSSYLIVWFTACVLLACVVRMFVAIPVGSSCILLSYIKLLFRTIVLIIDIYDHSEIDWPMMSMKYLVYCYAYYTFAYFSYAASSSIHPH